MNKTRVLIAGASGQLGHELVRSAPESVDLIALDETQLDITGQASVSKAVDSISPDWIINAAAYTAVDKAEQQSELAYRVNRDGAINLALAAKQADKKLIHISTDFVFDGTQSSPYQVADKPNPKSVYGASKQAGDEHVMSILSGKVLIIRTAWVYSSHGQNFVKTMLKLMAERNELGIVADQAGTPTWTRTLAQVIWKSMGQELTGIHHCTDAGVASWYDFAVAIYEEAKTLGLLDINHDCEIMPISTKDYPAPAVRPASSVLDKTITWEALDIKPLHWRESLRYMMKELLTDQKQPGRT